MADEIPPAPSENPEDVTKSETIRITLPPKSEQPAVKRETVRINVPGKPVPPAPGITPKKETTKLPTEASGATPPPPAPKPLPTVQLPAARPLSGATPPPKPPSLGARPTVPLKPGPGSSISAPPEPVTMKAAAPKKETARITLPPEGTSKPALPKATVKMQQTQPLVKTQSSVQHAPQLQQQSSPSMQSSGPAADPLMGPLSIAAFVLSLAAAGVVYLIFAAASNPLQV